MNALLWDDELASIAKSWANKCEFKAPTSVWTSNALTDKFPQGRGGNLKFVFDPNRVYIGSTMAMGVFPYFDDDISTQIRVCKTRRIMYRAIDIGDGDRFEDVPKAIQYLDFREFGVPIWQFLHDQLAVREFQGFWKLFQFVTLQIETPTSIALLEDNANLLLSRHNPYLADDTDFLIIEP